MNELIKNPQLIAGVLQAIALIAAMLGGGAAVNTLNNTQDKTRQDVYETRRGEVHRYHALKNLIKDKCSCRNTP